MHQAENIRAHAHKEAQFPDLISGSALCIALALALSACGKSDRVPTTAERLNSVQQKQETQPDFYVPRKTVDYMADLKSLKDAPAKPEHVPVVPVKAEPAKAEPKAAPQETKVAVAPAPAPVVQQPVTPPPAAAAVPPPKVVASAAPTARPAPPRQDAVPIISVVSREQPSFPREALRSGVETGNVRARMTINAAGEVTNVAILQAQPARVFDRSVQQALSRWKFNPGTEGRTFDTEIGFKAAN
ncbi:MAG: TonB family protein [Betaproteobacteria bacterium]